MEVEEGAESPDLEAKAAGERGAKRKVIQRKAIWDRRKRLKPEGKEVAVS